MDKTRGLNFVPEPETDGSDIRGYPNPRVKLPSLHSMARCAIIATLKVACISVSTESRLERGE
jgi:hypothetical protein